LPGRYPVRSKTVVLEDLCGVFLGDFLRRQGDGLLNLLAALLDRLSGNRDAPPRRLTLQGRLMIRNSCRPLRPAKQNLSA